MFFGNEEEELITIGAVFPISNDFIVTGSESATWGIHSAFGTFIAKKAINKDGGVLGKNFDLIILDGKGNPKTALQMYEEHKNNGVVAVIGPPIGAIAAELFEKAKNDGLPFLTQTLPPQQMAARREYYKGHPAMKDLSDTYLTNFGYGPPQVASNACECILMLADAIKLAGGTNKKDVVSALNEISQKFISNPENSKS
ncbi:MAG: ABC transporter substrate-binding protein [Holophagales bacterium]|nr:ABC transporter substrate-binding protein [Holophagales bacterium]